MSKHFLIGFWVLLAQQQYKIVIDFDKEVLYDVDGKCKFVGRKIYVVVIYLEELPSSNP